MKAILIALCGLLCLLSVGCSSPTETGKIDLGARKIDLNSNDVTILEINSYFSPFAHGPTQNFFHDVDGAAVIQVTPTISSATIKVHVFDYGDSDNIWQWVNNQHSDALFGGAPVPVTTELPLVENVSATLTGTEVGPSSETYDVYEVTYRIPVTSVEQGFSLAAYQFTTAVFVRTDGVGLN